jgi:acyl transferase domain-containing protein
MASGIKVQAAGASSFGMSGVNAHGIFTGARSPGTASARNPFVEPLLCACWSVQIEPN